VVNKASLIFVVIQASGIAAPAGAASAAPSTTAMTLYLTHIHDRLCMMILPERPRSPYEPAIDQDPY
jgi:hypothetical protein